MKKILINCFIIGACAAVLMGCKRDSDYIAATPSIYIANFDLRKIYTGTDVTLTTENMRGATYLRGQVISDHSGNNMPAGLLVIQNLRKTGNGIDSLRGMSVNIGADAAKYVPGDSVHVKIEGGVLKRVNGILQITGVSASDVTKMASGKPIMAPRGFANLIAALPDRYESTLINIVKGTYNPLLGPNDILAGDKILNDGSSDIILHTEANATFANTKPPFKGNYLGVLFNRVGQDGKLIPEHRLRTASDLIVRGSTADVPEFVITGFINDPAGTDANNEYIQFRATKNINFAVTPFSVITTNNAGSAPPTGAPANGWATGQLRTYKINLTSGSVVKGEFFYVGGNKKLINSTSSTSMAASKWISAIDYNKASDRFNSGSSTTGTATTNLLANSGNAFGMAVFRGIEVTLNTIPIDVVFVHDGGSLYQAGPAPSYGVGYRIGDTDIYDVIEPVSGAPQPYFLAGTNKQKFTYVTPGVSNDDGYFYILGGTFDTVQGKWVNARSQIIYQLSKSSTVAEIEGGNATVIK